MLIEVPNVVYVKVLVLTFNMILISSPKRVLTPSYPFRTKIGDKVSVPFPEKLKIVIDDP